MVLAGCGNNAQQSDSEIASVSKQSLLSIDCLRSADMGRSVSTRDHMKVDINGKAVSFTRIILIKNSIETKSVIESFKGTVNSVFDFNSVSKNTARLLLNPLTLTSVDVDSGERTEKKFSSLLVQYANGELKITERDGKKVFSHSNCIVK
jgi:hypothetical protein